MAAPWSVAYSRRRGPGTSHKEAQASFHVPTHIRPRSPQRPRNSSKVRSRKTTTIASERRSLTLRSTRGLYLLYRHPQHYVNLRRNPLIGPRSVSRAAHYLCIQLHRNIYGSTLLRTPVLIASTSSASFTTSRQHEAPGRVHPGLLPVCCRSRSVVQGRCVTIASASNWPHSELRCASAVFPTWSFAATHTLTDM